MLRAATVANYFIKGFRDAGADLSVPQLMRLLYISNGWHLELQGYPLYRDRTEAWSLFPVIPELRKELEPQGVYVDQEVLDRGEVLSKRVEKFLDWVLQSYGSMGSYQLSVLFDEHITLWEVCKKVRGLFAPIPTDLTKLEFENLRRKPL